MRSQEVSRLVRAIRADPDVELVENCPLDGRVRCIYAAGVLGLRRGVTVRDLAADPTTGVVLFGDLESA